MIHLPLLIVLVGRVFSNGPGDLGSIPGRFIPKTLTLSNIRYVSTFGECGVPHSLPSLPGPLWPEVVAPDRLLFMDQIDWLIGWVLTV